MIFDLYYTTLWSGLWFVMDLGFPARHLAEDGPNIYEAMIGLSTHTDKGAEGRTSTCTWNGGPVITYFEVPMGFEWASLVDSSPAERIE